jgi:hypothetical protein
VAETATLECVEIDFSARFTVAALMLIVDRPEP